MEIAPKGIDLDTLKDSNNLDEVLSTLLSLLEDCCCTIDAETILDGNEVRDVARRALKEFLVK